MKDRQTIPCCPPKPKLDERPLITSEQAAGLMDLFKVFANDTRLRLLHALARSGELCVSDLAAAVAMKPQAVSNQLQRLVDRGLLGSRREGKSNHTGLLTRASRAFLIWASVSRRTQNHDGERPESCRWLPARLRRVPVNRAEVTEEHEACRCC